MPLCRYSYVQFTSIHEQWVTRLIGVLSSSFEMEGLLIMILSGSEIRKNLGSKIIIEPFSEECLNPNSYNLHLFEELLVYKDSILDCAKANDTERIIIPENGYLLQPGQLYLGRSEEYTETHEFVPMIQGRSSLGRLGVTVHITAGFGDIGFCGYWTLQLACVKPTVIYPHMKICQVYYQTVLGACDVYTSSKYQNNTSAQASRIYEELQQH